MVYSYIYIWYTPKKVMAYIPNDCHIYELFAEIKWKYGIIKVLELRSSYT